MHKATSWLILLGFTLSAACGETTPEPMVTDLGSAGGDANLGGGGAGGSPAPGGAGQTQIPPVGGGGNTTNGGASGGGGSGGTQSVGGSGGTQSLGGSGGTQSLGGSGGNPPNMDTEISLQVACDPVAEAMPDLNEILALKANPNRGAAAYLNACSFCHASGGGGMTLGTGVKVPPLKGIPWTCKQVLTFRDGVPNTPMLSFAATHDAQWMADMIAHVQTNL